jgi:hypothetical protein
MLSRTDGGCRDCGGSRTLTAAVRTAVTSGRETLTAAAAVAAVVAVVGRLSWDFGSAVATAPVAVGIPNKCFEDDPVAQIRSLPNFKDYPCPKSTPVRKAFGQGQKTFRIHAGFLSNGFCNGGDSSQIPSCQLRREPRQPAIVMTARPGSYRRRRDSHDSGPVIRRREDFCSSRGGRNH